MYPYRSQKRRWLPLAVPLALLLALPATSAAALPPDGETPHTDLSVAGPNGQSVTLITGDQVHVAQAATGRVAATIEPAPRANHRPTFETIEAGEHLYVLPADVVPLVGETLDKELFNVTRLLEYGYTDGTPVIMTGDGGPAPLAAPVGATVTRPLPSIDGAAATIEADGSWWSALSPAAGPQALSGAFGSGKVWLDGLAEVALAESVPLVGAPQAWDAGYDGTGLTVAVLDTGIDAEHPDLDGKVVMAENFTSEPDETDENGHGTHVASTVAGTGSASDGQYTGVAPGADLLNGKICNAGGSCQQSWIIAGMEWGAENADVVSISVGSNIGMDGTDPMSQAVNSLTDEHDTLFVIAAGNNGFQGEGSIASPGAADAALAVGSVDKDEELAGSSSIGPRLGDYAIKPDMTAPGVSIVAARGEGTDLGQPVDDFYTELSGTSMATPHVSGAAAILLQEDPDLGAVDLKAALAATAVPNDDLTVYQQGGGRLDVPRALDAPVRATPSPADLGYFQYPHDDAGPVEEQVTYTNRTDEAVTLDLSLDVTSDEGDVPPAEMLSVEPATLDVPAGGSVSATVTVDVSHGEIGLYGGYLVAEAGSEVATRTPVGFYKEQEMYELTVEGIARDGRLAAGSSSVNVLEVHDTSIFLESLNRFSDGVSTLRVPPGTYHVMGNIYTYDGHDQFPQSRTMVGEPEVEVTGDTTVMVDARDGTPLQIETPAHEGAEPRGQSRVAFYREASEQGSFAYSVSGGALPTYAAPTDPVTLGEFEFNTRTRLGEPEVAVRVSDPVEQRLTPRAMSGSPPLDDELSLPVVWAGHGAPEDYDGVDADGAAVLTLRGGPGHAAKEQTARENGAAALMVANDAAGNYSGSVGEAAQIPTMTLPGEERDILRDMLDDDPVMVDLWGTTVTPYQYDVVFAEPDRIPDELHYVAETDELATLVQSFHSDVLDHERGEVRHFWRPYETLSVGLLTGLPVPQERVEYLVGGDTRYRQQIYGERPFTGVMYEPLTFYESGEHRDQSWFKSPVRPGVLEGGPHQDAQPVTRTGDTLEVLLPEWVDSQQGHWGWMHSSVDTSAFRLFQDGDLIAEADRPRGEFTLDPDPAEYRIEADLARDAEWWTTSSESHTAWTFQSERADGEDPASVPLLLVDYDVDLDLTNTAERTFLQPVGLQFRHQPGVDGPRVSRATVEVSYDDGDTWDKRPAVPRGGGEFTALLPPFPPHDAEFVSLRVSGTDRDGNGVEQEAIRAWHLP